MRSRRIAHRLRSKPSPAAPKARGVRVIIAAAGMAAALPGVIAANTTLPVIGVPIKGMLDGLDALLSIVQMPPGIPQWLRWDVNGDNERGPCLPHKSSPRSTKLSPNDWQNTKPT